MNIGSWLGWAVVCCAVVVSSVFAEEEAPEVDRTKSRMSYIENDRIKLGVDLNVGGAVTYLAEKGGDNLINSTDWGRQIQMSFYSGPIPFEPNGKKPMGFWRGLGWNPIQAGDSYAHGSKVVEHRNEGDKLYVKCVPMQWPLNNEPGECTFECWYELEGNVVKGRYKLNNSRSDKKQYPGRNQELPAVYANGRWSRIFTYLGDKPFTGAPLTEIAHLWKGGPTNEPWGRWQTPERWAAMVDREGRGLGVWSRQATEFNGGYFGTVVGEGGAADLQTNYLGPVRREIIDHNIEYEYSTHLIVGSLEEIRQYVYEKTPRTVSPDYLFKHSRDGWVYDGATDSGWPIRDELDIRFSGGDAMLAGPPDFWLAQDVPGIRIKAALLSENASCALLWKTSKDSGFSDARSKSVDMIGDGVSRDYTVEPSDCPAYQGGIVQIALKIKSAAPGDTLKIDYVGLSGYPCNKGEIK
ncbi:MAG: hypothetical protein DRP64_11440 [Verrucomicrobia bacterium]|nr:MAG: hypothetical protein DRP64_11440 [Verrucomicrobiota bacterium]